MTGKTAYYLSQISQWDAALCVRINRVSRKLWIGRLFGMISRLGNGLFWYALMLALLLWDFQGALRPVLHMIITGLTCTVLYKWIKGKTLRPRPFEFNREIILSVAPLDQFSFPSGHTLHAIAFTLVALAYYPALGWLLIPFTGLVAMSRLVLGLHYPSDVLAGAALGALIAIASFVIL